jgi:uncharacterized protein YlxP (DUF503 family)
MIVGVCRITLLISEAHSLKERRMVLRRIKDKVRNKFNVAIAEVGGGEYADAWQSAQLGFAVVSNELGFTQAMVQKVLDYIDALSTAKVVDEEQDFMNYGDERGLGAEPGHWEPDDFERPEPRGEPNDSDESDEEHH